jgi:SAM-dependent methyltransferase
MPTDEALNRLYNEANYWAGIKPVISPRKQPAFLALARSRWSLIQSHFQERNKKPDGLKILDVGAGFGYLGLVVAQARGIRLAEYAAVEPDANVRSALTRAWPRFGQSRTLKTFANLEQVKGRYDIIVLSHVLEHIKNPVAMIRAACSVLGNTGVLLIDVPNRDYLFKADVFPHLLFYSPKSLSILMNRIPLRLVDLDTWGNPFERSPLNAKAPFDVKIRGKLIVMMSRWLSPGLSSSMIAGHFQVNARNRRGTWIRALAQVGANG